MRESPTACACRLCGSNTRIVESHIIPAFVGRWLKDTSATGFLRGILAPNRRMQDFPTVRLLCKDCEQRFSTAEKNFAELVFLPFHQQGRSRFSYGDWLLYFAASLAWRCLVSSERDELLQYPQHVKQVDHAREVWTDFLLGRTDSTGSYRFNLFFMPDGGSSEHPLPEGLAWYHLRATDWTQVFSRARAAAYAKLPGMLFWTSVVPPDPGGWRGTRIAKHGTIYSKNQIIKDGSMGEFLLDRCLVISKARSDLSAVQMRRIEDAIRRNPQRAVQSGDFTAWLEEERIRRHNSSKS